MIKTGERYQKAYVALFFAVLALIGVFTLNDYTGSYDELPQRDILRVNLKEYAQLLARVGFRWEYGLELDVPPASGYLESDHGIAAFYALAPFVKTMDQSHWHASTLWSAMTWLWFMVGVWSLYAIARRLQMPRPLAMLAALLLFLCPRLFAQGHYNDKDLVLLCEVLLCLWLGMRLLDRMSFGRALLFSLAGAMAANHRIVGILPWALICVCACVMLTVKRGWSLKTAGLAAFTAAAFAAGYYALTPAMWQDPLGYFAYLLGNTVTFQRWSGVIYFRDAAFSLPENKLPPYYLLYMLVVTLPLYTFPLLVIGQVSFIRRVLRSPKALLSQPDGLLLCCATLCWFVPVAAFAVLRPLVYNGWRHFFFCYAGVAIMAGYGIHVLYKVCERKRWLKRLCAIGLCVCFGATAAGMALNHPTQACYYNVLANKGVMETDYWNSAGTAALKRLAASEARNQALPMEVGCYFFDLQNARFKLDSELQSKLTTTVQTDSPYLYYIQNYVEVYCVPPPEGYHVLFTMESYGRTIGVMYERDA